MPAADEAADARERAEAGEEPLMRRTIAHRAVLATAAGAVLLASACTSPPGTPHPWEEARAGGPRELVVSFWGSPPLRGPTDYCGADYSARVSESSERVVITVHGHRNTPPPNVRVACTAIAARRDVPVMLAAPLGGRTLIDGATGETRPLS
jgi:hypothetical protein